MTGDYADGDQWQMGEHRRPRGVPVVPMGRRHLIHDPNAPGGTVVCFCPIARDHNVTAFHDQPAGGGRRR